MTRFRFAALACLGVLSACGGGGGGGDGPALPARVAPALNFPGSTVETGDIAIERAYPNLRFDLPASVKRAPGDSTHLYVAELGGRILSFDATDPAVATVQTFIDLSDRTRFVGEQGLLDFAFDPDYARNGRVYIHYNDNVDPQVDNGDTVVARYSVDLATRVADRTSEVELFRFPQPFSNHNGGSIEFGPDGKLYIALGDGGAGNDPENRAQNLGNPLGKILRIESDGSIPQDNPFVSRAGARGEIWAYGLRNPFRMSFDGDRLWVGDVGQNAREEINLIAGGGNYGWRKFEGTRLNFPNDPPVDAPIAPVFEYSHQSNGGGASITGGRVYRGTAIPALVGRYVYGDFSSQRIWALAETDGRATENVLIGTAGPPSSFGTDLAGEMLLTGFDGELKRLVPAGAGSAGRLPEKLSDTGLFSDLATLTPAPGVVPYTPNAPFWSDGASKHRWIAVPGSTQTIAFSATGNWSFPVGTVTVKHFEITLADQRTVKRLETRVFLHTANNGWQGFSYRWNEAGTDADLLPGSEPTPIDLSVADGKGGTRNQTYQIPSRSQCLSCHTAAAGQVLGLRTAQLNGGASGNQLRALNAAGYFDRDIGDPAQYAALVDPYGSTAPTLRARSYLETNCAQCHQPGGPTGVDMDLRAATPAGAGSNTTQTHGVSGSGAPVGGATVRIVPTDAVTSLVWTRMNSLAEGERMPPLSTHVIDEQGVALIGGWIDAGAP